LTCAIVERMAVLDDDFSAGARLAEGGDGIWSPSGSTPAVAPQDFQALYEQQRARAGAAEARCEELRWAEVAARSDAGSWKSRFKSCRRRLMLSRTLFEGAGPGLFRTAEDRFSLIAGSFRCGVGGVSDGRRRVKPLRGSFAALRPFG